jgi:hypothetical protein
MDIVIIPFAIVAASFLILRKFFLRTGESQPTSVQLFIIGIVSWIFILGAAVWFLLPFYLFYVLIVMRGFGAVVPLAFFAIISGLAYQLNETLDSATVLHYLRESAFFRPIRPDYMHIAEELEKKRIREVHRETSDMPFPTTGEKKRLLTEKEAHQYKQEMITARERPNRSRRYDEEIASLKSSAVTSLADGWKVYTFNSARHDFYAEMSRLQINPVARALQFNLNIPDATEQALQDPQYLYRLKQELYQLLSVLHTDPWLSSYSVFFDRITTVCYGIEPDSFAHAQLFPFMRVDIAASELHQREGKFFNAADLHKISTLTFNNGKPLPDEPV